jgi:hypothetical protein
VIDESAEALASAAVQARAAAPGCRPEGHCAMLVIVVYG